MRSFGAGLIVLAMLSTPAWGQMPAGSEFQVNTYTTNNQTDPAVAVDGSGNFVVVWESSGPDGDYYGVFGQRFAATGAAQGSEFRVNTYTTGNQVYPSVASGPTGNFVVVWTSRHDGNDYGIFGQRFDVTGLPLGGEFQVNSYTTDRQFNPSVASDANGNFVVVWTSYLLNGSGYEVFGRRFNASGGPQGAEFHVNSYTSAYQGAVSVASDAIGNFVVVWDSGGQDGNGYGIFGRRFNASGTALGAEFRVNTYTTDYQLAPTVASDPSGNFVVVWQSTSQDGSGYGVFGQRFNALGALLGGEFRASTYTTGPQHHPRVTSDENGNFVVVWASDDGSGYGVFGQHFDAAGVPQGSEFQVNTYTLRKQYRAAVASSPDGDFVVAWRGYGEPGSGYGIFGQRFGDLIFEDGFGSGDLSRWSSASTDGSDLSVSGAAALAGTSSGLQAVVNDTNSLFVQDDTPNAESRYRVRFYVDTNGFDPGESQSHFRTRILIAQGSGFRVITIVLKRQLGAYTVETRVRRNDGTRADTGFFPISDGPHLIEFDWQRATGPGVSDGSLQMWIDGGPVATLSGIDNDLVPIDLTRMGALSIKTGAAGTLYYDQFESRRQRLIGAE